MLNAELEGPYMHLHNLELNKMEEILADMNPF